MNARVLARDVVLILVGSASLYVAMVACSSAQKSKMPGLASDAGDHTGPDAGAVADGSVSTGGAGALDASGQQGSGGAQTPDASVKDSGAKDSGGLIDALADAVGDVIDAAPDAVPDAAAQEATVVVAPCNVKGNDGYYWAEASFPGKTVDELAGVHYYYAEAAPELDGYTHRTGALNLLLKPGGVALACGTATEGMGVNYTFVLP
jgi:hypothetical protein